MQAKLNSLYERERQRVAALAAADASLGEYTTPVFGEGPASPKLMLIGEAPGKEESRLSHPFVGKAGKQLDELLSGAGIERGEVFVTNTVKYRPTKQGARGAVNRTPTKNEVADSLWLLREELRLVRPKVVATLGNTPLFAMLTLAEAEQGTIGDLHGRPVPLSVDGYSFLLFPLYHPASGIYNRKLLSVMEEDIRSLRSLLDQI